MESILQKFLKSVVVVLREKRLNGYGAYKRSDTGLS